MLLKNRNSPRNRKQLRISSITVTLLIYYWDSLLSNEKIISSNFNLEYSSDMLYV